MLEILSCFRERVFISRPRVAKRSPDGRKKRQAGLSRIAMIARTLIDG